ncbi:MAG: tRNA pseudouridine(54/55) synthase Pus10 [Methanobacteriales archaeon Met13]
MDSNLKNKSIQINSITKGEICDRCLGRHLSPDIPGECNSERGAYVRKNILKHSEELKDNSKCTICSGIFDQLEDIVKNVIDTIEDKGVEFSTFLVGCRLSPEIMNKEDEIHQEIELKVESIKKEVNREVGKLLYQRLGKEVDFDSPQLVIMINLSQNKVNLQINPLFIEGRYRKLVRDIPQTKWPCRKCKGKGCECCDYTGKMYTESVEELVSPDVLKAAQGTGSKFHGAGREDIDVRMLGRGRPFVMEIKEPLKRDFNFIELEKKINKHGNGKVEVLNLQMSRKERKGAIKTSSTDTYKTYKARVKLEEDVSRVKLEVLDSLSHIEQRTPIRVSHRRADKIRKREVKNINVKQIDNRTLELTLACEGGLYIKELISGDDGRTQPSVSSLLNIPARCIELDVLEVNI